MQRCGGHRNDFSAGISGGVGILAPDVDPWDCFPEQLEEQDGNHLHRIAEAEESDLCEAPRGWRDYGMQTRFS